MENVSPEKNCDKKIIMSVKRGTYRNDDPEKEHSDERFKTVRLSVLDKSDYTCHYCEIKSKKYLEVHHKNDDHSCNDESNLLPICPLCHAPFHIGYSGIKKKGVIIYTKSISQINLNILVRTLWVAQDGNDPKVKDFADNLLSQLRQKERVAKELLTNDPIMLASQLSNLNDDNYKERESRLDGYLFLPFKEAFLQPLEYWKENIYKHTPPSSWAGVIKDIEF